ncbi:MAG: short-chain dehydrogenase [Naasia sp.]|jgi:short-subunit dehydrogenase|uniref:SDR family oxidoreductase n=1 Tax=Naasia sp. TaxID=2546198 RepID=UPI00262DE580|nr:SDR family oxidoreductase [Naasia sp.]MCU1571215.1 short-chain dehydrogenase [Naasia sp.]
MSVKSSVVVITGASSGIGRATALRFAKKGASVVLASRRETALQELAVRCQELGGSALAVPTDVSDAAAVQALADAAIRKFGRIDVWVNNAAISVYSPFLEMPLDDLRRVLDVNILGYVYGARAALLEMTKEGRGSLINVASIVGEIPQPYTAAYGMSKAAVRALGVSLRSELWLAKQKRIKVSTVLPATIDTRFFQHSANYTGRKVVAMPPVYPAELVAKAIVDLVKDPKDEVTVGALGKTMVKQHRAAPGPLEAQMAVQVERTHLSRTEPVAANPGTIYEPAADPADATVSGGWHGASRTARRVVVGPLLLAGGGALAWRALGRRGAKRS